MAEATLHALGGMSYRQQVAALEDAIQRAIAYLDTLCGDPDLELGIEDEPHDDEHDAELTASETHGRGFPGPNFRAQVCGMGCLDDAEIDGVENRRRFHAGRKPAPARTRNVIAFPAHRSGRRA